MYVIDATTPTGNEFVEPMKQSNESVITLLQFLGKEVDEMPDIIKFNKGDLVRSDEGDGYYFTTQNGCSCPDSVYRHRTCKHMNRAGFRSVHTWKL